MLWPAPAEGEGEEANPWRPHHPTTSSQSKQKAGIVSQQPALPLCLNAGIQEHEGLITHNEVPFCLAQFNLTLPQMSLTFPAFLPACPLAETAKIPQRDSYGPLSS